MDDRLRVYVYLDLLRVYLDPDEIGPDGYPFAWHKGEMTLDDPEREFAPAVKDLIRQQAGNRCERCGHPYKKGMGEWSPCDDRCAHAGPIRRSDPNRYPYDEIEAQWRILTVHHLNGIKHDLRWWNLAALCQRCHLTIQAKVHLARPYDREHTPWFRPHAAGYYASIKYEDAEPTREWVLRHMDEILAEHAVQGSLL